MHCKQINIRMSSSLIERLKKQAQGEGISLTELVNRILIGYFNQDSYQFSEFHIEPYSNNHLEAQYSFSNVGLASLNQFASSERRFTSDARYSLVANRLACLENHVLSLQHQVSKWIADSEQRFFLLEARLLNNSLQFNPTSTQQSSSYQMPPFHLSHMSTHNAHQLVDSPPSAQTIVDDDSQLSVQPSHEPVVEQVSGLNPHSPQWLTLAEAYEIAQHGGYRLSPYAFQIMAMQSTSPIREYGEYGLGVDRSRRGTAGITTAWFYRLD